MPLLIERIQTRSEDLQRFQDKVVAAVNPVLLHPLLPGVLLKGVKLTGGAAKEVEHQLGRRLRGWSVIRRYDVATEEAWNEVGSTGEPAFQNGWVNYDSTHNSAAFWKDSNGVVHLKGLVKSGTISTTLPIFTLPAGYRPAKKEIIVTISNGALGRVNVESDGDVVPETGNNAWFSLDGVSFRASGTPPVSADIWDEQEDNNHPDRLLILNSVRSMTVDLYVF